MNIRRLLQEIGALQRRYTVRVDLNEETVDLERVRLPPGWTPRVATIRYDLPADYASSPPTVHVPAELRFRGKRPIRMRRSRFEGMRRWCLAITGWESRRHTMVTLTRTMQNHTLPDPSKSELTMP